MLPTFSQNLTLQEAFETITHMNKELKEWDLMVYFAKKNLNLYSIENFFHFFFLLNVEKMIHQEKNRVTKCKRLLNPGEAVALPSALSLFIFLLSTHIDA